MERQRRIPGLRQRRQARPLRHALRGLDFSYQPALGKTKPGYRAYCHPDNFEGLPNVLYRNNGDGTFTDVSRKSGIASAIGKGLGVAFADFDHDGFIDVYVANDSVQSFLFRNNGNGTFAEVGLLSGVGFNEDGKTFAGMGVDFADYDNDGNPDVFVTDLSNERYRLFRHNGDGTFRDVTNSSGVGGATLPYSGWSTRFFDYDNDGWKDIFVTQGHVMDTIEKTSPNLSYRQPPLLLRNQAARFVRVSPGEVFRGGSAGRGAAFGDLDNDGDIDVITSNVGQKAVVLRNDGGNGRRWLGLRTVGQASNRDGIGCLVKVVSASGVTQHFTVNTAVGYLSASDKRLIVGLDGDSTATLVEIRWPSGSIQKFERVNAGQTLVANEPASAEGFGGPRRSSNERVGPNDHPPPLTRAACGSPGWPGTGAGHFLARRELAAARKAFRPAVSCALHGRGQRGRPDRSDRVRRHQREELHHRSRRLRRRVCRLRQRRVAGSVRAQRHPLGGRAAWRHQPLVQEQPRWHLYRRHGESRSGSHRLGLGRHGGRLRQRWVRRFVCERTTATTWSWDRNNGDGTFTDVTAKSGLGQDAVRYGSGCTWVDFDRDGHLDLCVANYLNTTLEKLPRPGENPDCTWKGMAVNCGPRGLPPGFVQLFR